MQIEEKKIMFVVPSLRGGGAEKVAATLLESLQKTDDDIKLVLVLFSKETKETLGQNIDVKYLDVHTEKKYFYTIIKLFKVIYRLAKIMKQEGPCSILSFMDYANIASIISNRLSKKRNRLIISVHTMPTFQMYKHAGDFWERVMGILIRRIYKKADLIIAVSEDVKTDMVKNFGIEKSRIYVINNPVDLDKINSLADEKVLEEIFNDNVPIILSVGRLSKEKGVDYLLRSLKLLEGRCNARLVILGQGQEEHNLKKLSRDLGIDEKVVFPGYKDNPYKYMKRSTIFVLSSLYEGFGIAMVEAMACGIPVIATKCYAGIEDIIEHEKTGLLIPVADEKALAESMFRLLDDEELRKSLSVEAKKKVESFSIEKITGKYKKVLLNI